MNTEAAGVEGPLIGGLRHRPRGESMNFSQIANFPPHINPRQLDSYPLPIMLIRNRRSDSVKRKIWGFLLGGLAFSSVSMATEVCLDNDGFIIGCPGAALIASHFSGLPSAINQPTTIYITGGGTLVGVTGFQVRANKQFVCDTGYDSPGFESHTPVRSCTTTIAVPGTYTFDAIPYGGGNFGPPSPTTIVVQ